MLQKSAITKSRQDQINRFRVPTDDFEAPRVSFVLVQSAKDLGVILDSNLAFDDPIKTTVSECIARLAQISRVKHCLDKTSLLTAINALVFSKLYYCSNVWEKYQREKYTEIAGCAELRMSNRLWREKVRSCNSPLKKFVLVTR